MAVTLNSRGASISDNSPIGAFESVQQKIGASVLRHTAHTSMLLAGGMVAIFLVIGPTNADNITVYWIRVFSGFGIVFISFVSLWILRQGNVRLAGLVFVSLLYSLLLAGAISGGHGVHSLSIPLLCFVIMFSGFVLSPHAGLLMTGLAILTVLGLYGMENAGLRMSSNIETLPPNMFVASVYVMLYCLLGWLSIRYSRVFRKAVNDEAHTQQLLAERELQLQTILDSEPACVKVVNAHGKLVQMNPAGLRMIEAESFEQVAGQALIELIAEPYRRDFAALHNRVMAGNEGVLEFEIIGLKGGRRRLETHAVPLRDSIGVVKSLLGVTRDITEASIYSRSLIEASLDPLVTISREGAITDVNRATELVTGHSREELIGSQFSIYFTEPERAQRGYELAFSEGIVTDFQLAIRHASGQITEVIYNATVYRNSLGEVLGVFAAARDITQRKLAERRLEEEKQRFSDFSTSSADWFWEMDADLRFTYFSDNFEQVYGLSPTSILGKTRPGLLATDQLNPKLMIDAHLAQLERHQPFRNFEYRIRDTGGNIRWVSAHPCQQAPPDNPRCTGMCIDQIPENLFGVRNHAHFLGVSSDSDFDRLEPFSRRQGEIAGA